MMKIQRIQLIWTAAVLLVAGCSQEQATDSEAYSDVRIELRSSIAGDQVVQPQEATRAAVDATKPMTFYFLRANETGTNTDSYPPYSNTVLSATRAGGAGVQPLTFESDLFYLSSGANSKFTGWYPAADSFFEGVPSWTLDGTQDVLTAAAHKGSLITPMPNLGFKHALSQLRFRLQAKDADTQAYWGSITRISLLWQPSVCLYDSRTNDDTGNVTFDPTGPTAHFEAKNIATGQVPTTPTVMSDPMMIVPQKDVALTLEIEGSTGKTGRVSIVSITYEPGKAYNIDLLFEETKVATGGASIAGDWIDDSTPLPPGSIDLWTDLSKDGTANCYVVTSNTIKGYSFDATKRGNGYESTTAPNVKGISYSSLPDLATAKEARVIWQTDGTDAVIKTVELSADKKKVEFTLGDAVEGNAVIGIFASSEKTAPCLWSWHIWRVNGALPADVDCVKTPSPTTASPTFKMMGLNLGAYNNKPGDPKSIGLLYQWGRKDPFPGPKDFTRTEPTNIYGSVSNNGTVVSLAGRYTVPNIESYKSGTEAFAVQYPGVFITSSTDPNDWMVTKNDYLWGTPWVAGGVPIGYGSYNNNQGVKSIYDPCPVGYRVPPQDTWSLQTTNGTPSNNGVILEKVAAGFWFPAAGLRSGVNVGELANSPSDGYCWSSSIYSAGNRFGGFLMLSNDGRVWSKNGDARAHGLLVRCVAE